MSGATNPGSPRWLEWLRRAWPYALLCIVVSAAGALYVGPRGLTRPERALLGSSAGSSASPIGLARESASDPLASVKQEVLTYYRSKYRDNDPGLSTEVVNYGCHVGVYVVKDGKVIKSFAYFGRGQFYEQNW
ncbi:MAG: hypothetical protein ACM3ZU_03605 [Bacteroidota bacterium]